MNRRAWHFFRDGTPTNGRIKSASTVGPPSDPGRERLSSLASGVWMVNVKLVTDPPGGSNAGLNDAVAPTGTPCTASVIGLDIAAPCMATAKLKVAALPAGTDWLVAPVAASVKSAPAPIVTTAAAEVPPRKFESPE